MKHRNDGTPSGKPDYRLHAPAAARNGDAIVSMITDLEPARTTVLEIGSGSGQHAVHVAERLTTLTWQPSDPDPTKRASIESWIAHSGVENVRKPLALDCAAPQWWQSVDIDPDLIVAINVTHIVAQPVVDGLLTGAGHLLKQQGLLALYGPFTFNGDYSATSNKSFDHMLRRQNPAWGLRDLNNISATAAHHGLTLDKIVAMPANNHTLILKRVA